MIVKSLLVISAILISGMAQAQPMPCGTHDEFKRLFDTPVDADGIPVGNPPMSNWPRVTI